MAEALGVAASGIAVVQAAMVVGKSVMMLRDLWKEVKDVPDTIKDLMHQFEVINPMLRMVEQNLSQTLSALSPGDGAAEPALAYVHQARDELVRLVDGLGAEIDSTRRKRRAIARLRVVLNKCSLARYEGRLRTALNLLTFTQQCYMVTYMTHLPDIVASKVSTVIEARQPSIQENAADGTAMPQETVQDATSEEKGFFPPVHLMLPKCVCTIKVVAPRWLIRKAIEINVQRALWGWQACLRVCNVRPSDSFVFMLAHQGDVEGVTELFQRGLASPCDVDDAGFGLLDHALVHPKWNQVPGRIKAFYGLGVRPWRNDTMNLLRLLDNKTGLPWDLQQIVRSMVYGNSLTTFQDTSTSPRTRDWHVWQYLPCVAMARAIDEETFEILLDIVGAERFYSVPLWIRLEHILENSFQPPDSVIRQFVRRKGDHAHIDGERSDSRPLSRISQYGRMTATTCSSCQWLYICCPQHWQARWKAFGDKLLASTGEVRNVWLRGGTEAVCHVLRNYNCLGIPRRTRAVLWEFIKMWLEAVLTAGYDLEAYGTLITAVYESGSEWEEPCDGGTQHYTSRDGGLLPGCKAACPVDEHGRKRSLRGLSYGPRLEDWHMARSVDYDQFAGDFWDLIADRGDNSSKTGGPKPKLPGAWLEED